MVASTTQFPQTPRRNDPNGYLVVWAMLLFLRNAYDSFTARFVSGSATVLSGNTTQVVTLGQSMGGAYSVRLTPTSDPGAGQRYWVSGKTATQFTINLSTAAGGGGLAFDWEAKS